MATTVKTQIQIEIEDIKITEWIDISSRDGRGEMPNTMALCAIIDGIYTQNIVLRYIPITSKNEIIEEITKVLRLEEKADLGDYLTAE